MAIAFSPHLAAPVMEDDQEVDGENVPGQPTCPDCGRGLMGAGSGYLACGQLNLADPNVLAGLELPSSHGGTEVIACGEHEAPDAELVEGGENPHPDQEDLAL